MSKDNIIDKPLNHRDLYRLPWTLTDHANVWLEPTRKCNMCCDGCYSVNDPASHKTLQQIKEELDVIEKYRTADVVLIAGGEPLIHPQIEEIVRLVTDRGFIPIIITNGLIATPQILIRLKNAGLKAILFHVDSGQKRPGWMGKNELELNELRLNYARMVAEIKGLSCGFNIVVYENTLKYVPKILEWAEKHIDLVHRMNFLIFRPLWEKKPKGQFEYLAKGKKIKIAPEMIYKNIKNIRTDITSREVVEEIRKKYSDFEPCGYTCGTEELDALKWLLAHRVGTKREIYGYLGPKLAEITQVCHHLFFGKYSGYFGPKLHSKAKWIFFASFIDKNTAKAFWRYLKSCLKNPLKLFSTVYLQTVMIVQPPDTLADGRQSMCDGCSDMTVWNGRLVWSCRLEEIKRYGCFLTLAPPSKKNPRSTLHKT